MNKLIATQVIASSVFAAASAHALTPTPGLEYSDVTLTIETQCSGCPAPATTIVPVGDATPFEHLTTFPGYSPFVITGSTQPNAFVSTSVAGNGVVGVGVSGVIGEPERWAEAVYEQTIRNPGSTDVRSQYVHIEIPEIRILTSFSEGAGDHPFSGVWRAEASIDLIWFTKDEDGLIIDTGNPLALSVIVDRTNFRSSPASITKTLSPQLEVFAAGMTGLGDVGGQIRDVFYTNQVPGTYDYDAIGHTFDAIETDVALGSLDTNDIAILPAFGSLEVTYAMRVSYTIDEALTQDQITAFEVMIGDPFEIGGSGGSFSIGEATVVPEPGASIGGAAALAAALGIRRSRLRV